MSKSLRELNELVGGELIGSEDIEIKGVGGANNASKDQITFALDQSFYEEAIKRAGAVIVSADLIGEKEKEKPLIVVDNPRYAFAKIAKFFTPQPYYKPGIDNLSKVSTGAQIGKGVSIHAGVFIEEGAVIGDEVILASGAYVGHDVEIGEGSIIHPNVVLEYNSKLGKRVEINAGSVIGAQGYGFEKGPGGYIKVPQFGNVQIGDDVEIGANVAIDRGATGSTLIKAGTKIDNLVHIAHNVEIGEESLIIGQVGIAGSAKIGKRVTLAGKSGVVGHLTIGDNTTVGAYSAVTNDIEENSMVSGYPAHDHRDERRIKAARKKLPQALKRIRRLEKKIESLENTIKEE